MPFGPYFVIQNHLTDTVLEIKTRDNIHQTQAVSTGYLIQVFQQNDHQLWMLDKDTKTIRNKASGFCLDVQEMDELHCVMVSPYQARKSSQRWQLTDNQIQQDDDFESVISLVSDHPITEEGQPDVTSPVVTKTVVTPNTNDESQLWKLRHGQAEYFYIISQHDDKVVDVKWSNPKAGAEVIVYTKWHELRDNQLWYQDTTGVIRNKMNDFALTAAEEEVTLQPYTSEEHQQWTISGSRIQSQVNEEKVIEAKPGWLSTYLSAVTYTRANSQHWFFEYPPDQAISLNHSGTGKYGFMRCRLNGAVLTVAVESQGPGTPVIIAGQRTDNQNFNDQLWYFEETTGILRTALNGFCLDLVETSKFVINPVSPFSKSQKWSFKDSMLHNKQNPQYVLEMCVLEDGSCELTKRKAAKEDEQNDGQKWDLEHVRARCMYLRNVQADLVMTVKDSNINSGAIIMMPKQKFFNIRQLWYEDEQGIIRSKFNGYTIDTLEKVAKVKPHNVSNEKQMWYIVGDRLQNKETPNVVLDVKGAKATEGCPIIEYKFHGGDNQRWQFDYLET